MVGDLPFFDLDGLGDRPIGDNELSGAVASVTELDATGSPVSNVDSGVLTAMDGRVDVKLAASDATSKVCGSDCERIELAGAMEELPLAVDEDALGGSSPALLDALVAPLNSSLGISAMAMVIPLMSPKRDDVTAVIGSHGWSSV